MTSTATPSASLPSPIRGQRLETGALPLWQVIIFAILAIWVISLPMLFDPIIRHDDYPALFAEPEVFWPKTLHEGRWLNYAWHLRGIVTPSWLNFMVYQALWAVIAASIATYATRRDTHPLFVLTLTLFILSSILSTLISLWFNTLIPGLAVIALYAILGGVISQRAHRMMLPVFVILGFWSYTTYPLILLALCMVQTRQRSVKDLLGLLILFVVSFALAVFVTYTLNWQVHGVFGVPLDDWRNATPAHDLASIFLNWPLVIEAIAWLGRSGSFELIGLPYVHLGLLVLAAAALIHKSPLEAFYLLMGLLAGFGLVVTQIMMTGAIAPPRAFIFAWVFYAIIVVRAAAELSATPQLPGRLMRNFALLMALAYPVLSFKQYGAYVPWQNETRNLAQQLNSIDPTNTRPLLVYGDVLSLESAEKAHIQVSSALIDRVRQLSGHDVILCAEDLEACDEVIKVRAEGLQDLAFSIQIDGEGLLANLVE